MYKYICLYISIYLFLFLFIYICVCVCVCVFVKDHFDRLDHFLVRCHTHAPVRRWSLHRRPLPLPASCFGQQQGRFAECLRQCFRDPCRVRFHLSLELKVLLSFLQEEGSIKGNRDIHPQVPFRLYTSFHLTVQSNFICLK